MAALAGLLLRVLLCMHAALLPFTPAKAADADPIFDYCVADLSSTNDLAINGLPCKQPSAVVSADFTSTVLRSMGNISDPPGFAVRMAAAGATVPGLNTQGLTLARFDYDAGGLVPLHLHPRASEVILVQEGALLVGFIDTNGKYFSATLYTGDVFVFPRGLIHFQLSLASSQPSVSFSSLNSQNPGISFVASAFFSSTPAIPTTVLQRSFALSEAQIVAIKRAFASHP